MASERPIRLGITGGIGSGKSTFADMFNKLGAAIIDADLISREITSPLAAGTLQIQATFGKQIFGLNGGLDRVALRDLIFKSPDAKAEVEKILHPLIRAKMTQEAEAATLAGHDCLVFDVPLLMESPGWRDFFDRVVVVDCLTRTQINRVKLRSGLTDDVVIAIMNNQATREIRLAGADFVIFNDEISKHQMNQLAHSVATDIGLSI